MLISLLSKSGSLDKFFFSMHLIATVLSVSYKSTNTSVSLQYTNKNNKKQRSTLTPPTPAVPNCCCSKGSAPYWSNPPFLIFDIRALWRSVLSARAPECQKLKMVV